MNTDSNNMPNLVFEPEIKTGLLTGLDPDYFENKVLELISNITNTFIQKLDVILERNRFCDDDSDDDCCEIVNFEFVDLDGIRGLKFKLICDHNCNYIYIISLCSASDLEHDENMFLTKNHNLTEISNKLKGFSNACSSKSKKYYSHSVDNDKCLKKWIKYYLSLYMCNNCNDFSSNEPDKLCFNCQTRELNTNYECSICLQTNNFGFIKIKKCGHVFHQKCFSNKGIKSCPLCRETDIDSKFLRTSFYEKLKKELEVETESKTLSKPEVKSTRIVSKAKKK